MEEIRLGTIGTGFIVRNILDNVNLTDGIRLEAVYSRTTEAGTSRSAANSDQGRKWMWSLSLPLWGGGGWNLVSCFQSVTIVPWLNLRGDAATTAQS